MTYKFINRFKRKSLSRRSHIPLLYWELEFAKYCSSQPPRNIPEDDLILLGPPPEVAQIDDIMSRMRLQVEM